MAHRLRSSWLPLLFAAVGLLAPSAALALGESLPTTGPLVAGSGSLPSTLGLLASQRPVRADPMRIWKRLTPAARVRSQVGVDSRIFLFEPGLGLSTGDVLPRVSLVDARLAAGWELPTAAD